MLESNDNNLKRSSAYIKQIKDALVEGSKTVTPRKRAAKTSSPSITITGNNNITGDGNNIFHIHPSPEQKKVVVVKAGDGTITAVQQAELKALVDEIVGLEARLKREPRSFAGVWGNLNKKMKVTRYVEIPLDKFTSAKKLLEKERAILLAMGSAPVKAPNWRNSRYKAINARAKEFPDGELRYRGYSQEKFGTGSLKELNDDQLDVVYRHVFGWARPGR